MASVERTPGIPTIAREDVADALLTIAKNPRTRARIFVTIGDVSHSHPRNKPVGLMT